MRTVNGICLALAGAALVTQPATPLAAHDESETLSRAEHDKHAISATLDAVYAAISGDVGEERDWDAMRALFTPEARLHAITPQGMRGGSVEDYIERSAPFLVQSGFTESALVNRIDIYGDLAQAWSSYAGTFTNADGTPGSVRGINSFQLMRQDDGSWLVHSIFWQAESDDNPLPTDMTGDTE